MNRSRIATGLVAALAVLLPLGSASARSMHPDHQPMNVVRPAISGSPVVGRRLTISKGSWSRHPTWFRYQWYDCASSGGNCVRVRGATDRTFLLKARDLGSRVAVLVNASNAYGTGAARSLATQVVASSQPGAPPLSRSCSGVGVSPGDDAQALINGHSSGTTFCFAPGTYRLRSALTLKSNDVLDGGGRQAVFDGSRDITSAFTPSGSVWVAGRQTQSLTYKGQCEAAKPLCQQADDVFYDGRPLTRVDSVSAVGRGRFYFDHAADNIYIGDNPAGHLVEAAVTVEAVHGYGTGADGVTIRGLVVQHFANHGIQCRGNTWTVDSSEIRYNHGDGLVACATVLHSNLHDNGKDGYIFGGQIGSSEGPYHFSYNTVSGNNYAGFNPNWEAGGAKFMQMAHLTVSHNLVSGNDGNGLWTDWGNQFITYDSNTITNNTEAGIFHEASYDATISNNTITGNGAACSSTLCNSGIMMNDSQNVAIFGNTLSGNRNGIGMTQTDRGSTTLGPLVTQNVSVHDNDVTHSGRSGLVEWVNDGSYYTIRNNHFSLNTYNVCGDSMPFIWQDPSNPNLAGPVSWRQWRTDGNDTSGSYGCG